MGGDDEIEDLGPVERVFSGGGEGFHLCQFIVLFLSRAGALSLAPIVCR